MISLSDAQQLVIEQAASFGIEKISLGDALGRVLAEDIVADRDYPPFNRSTMDGFAITFADWQNGIRTYSIVETIYAGQENLQSIQEGECYKIMTGAAVPEMADVVIKKEDTVVSEDCVNLLSKSVNQFQNIAKKGEDLFKGEDLSINSMVCSPAIIGVLASLGKNEIQVQKLPSVSVITTGDEIVPVNDYPSGFQIRNSNAIVLQSLFKQSGISAVKTEHVKDNKEKISKSIESNLLQNILVINGGVSAGDADYVPGILEQLGVKKLFHKVAIKPGRPIWVGKYKDGAMVFALPGNPLSCIVTFKLFIETFLSVCMGNKTSADFLIPLKEKRNNKTGLDEFFPVKLNTEIMQAEQMPFNGSGDITAAVGANGIAHHPASIATLEAGQNIHFYSL